MSEERKYRKYNAEDIEKYHKGLLSPQEMNELERFALDDPFLADALEGYGSVSVNAGADLSELEEKLRDRIGGGKVITVRQVGSPFKWWRVAAAILIIGAVGYGGFVVFTTNQNKEVAQVKEKENVIDQTQPSSIASDSTTLPSTDSIGLASSHKNSEPSSSTALLQRRKSAPVSKSTTDTPAKNDLVATESAPIPSVASGVKLEKDDSTTPPSAAVNSRETFARTKMPVQDSRQSQAYPLKQESEMGLRGQQSVNLFRGRVVDQSNNPLPFANITNTKDNVGTYTDVGGNFILMSPDSTLDVQVRSIGFESNRARLKNSVSSNQVVMEEEKSVPDKVISNKKTDTLRSLAANMEIEQPEPADGWSNYDLYLANNINVTDDLKKKTTHGGQVRLSFDINQNGNPTNIRVEKSLCKECDEEAIRLIKEGPKWKKKNKNKRAQRVTINVPFESTR